MKRRIPLVLAAIALLLAGPAGAGDLDRSFRAASGGTLRIEVDRGSVDVVQHGAREVRIQATSRGVGASSVRFELESAGGDVRLTGSGEPWLDLLKAGPNVRVRAWVPTDFDVEVLAPRPGHRVAPAFAPRGGGLVVPVSAPGF